MMLLTLLGLSLLCWCGFATTLDLTDSPGWLLCLPLELWSSQTVRRQDIWRFTAGGWSLFVVYTTYFCL